MSLRFAAASIPRRLLFFGAVTVAAMVPAGVAMADDHRPLVGADHHFVAVESGPLIAGLLDELGVEPDRVSRLTGDLRDGVAERVAAMLDEGVVSLDQIESLGEVIEAGTLSEHLPATLEDAWARRIAFNDAARTALAHLGVEVGDDESVHDALRAHGLTPPVLPPSHSYPSVDPGAPVVDPVDPVEPVDDPADEPATVEKVDDDPVPLLPPPEAPVVDTPPQSPVPSTDYPHVDGSVDDDPIELGPPPPVLRADTATPPSPEPDLETVLS